ncbi:MAG: hypothetical protein ACRCSU_05600 [Paracoccaceae bacterium]
MSNSTFHSPHGGFDFLGMRKRAGRVEIIYDDGVARRMVWRVRDGVNEGVLGDALRHAVNQSRVLPALLAELRRRSINVEAIV